MSIISNPTYKPHLKLTLPEVLSKETSGSDTVTSFGESLVEGAMDSDSNWILSGSAAIADGKLTVSNGTTASSAAIYVDGIVLGKSYKVIFDVVEVTSAGKINLSNSSFFETNYVYDVTTAQQIEKSVVCEDTTKPFKFYFQPDVGVGCVIDNLRIHEITTLSEREFSTPNEDKDVKNVDFKICAFVQDGRDYTSPTEAYLSGSLEGYCLNGRLFYQRGIIGLDFTFWEEHIPYAQADYELLQGIGDVDGNTRPPNEDNISDGIEGEVTCLEFWPDLYYLEAMGITPYTKNVKYMCLFMDGSTGSHMTDPVTGKPRWFEAAYEWCESGPEYTNTVNPTDSLEVLLT